MILDVFADSHFNDSSGSCLKQLGRSSHTFDPSACANLATLSATRWTWSVILHVTYFSDQQFSALLHQEMTNHTRPCNIADPSILIRMPSSVWTSDVEHWSSASLCKRELRWIGWIEAQQMHSTHHVHIVLLTKMSASWNLSTLDAENLRTCFIRGRSWLEGRSPTNASATVLSSSYQGHDSIRTSSEYRVYVLTSFNVKTHKNWKPLDARIGHLKEQHPKLSFKHDFTCHDLVNRMLYEAVTLRFPWSSHTWEIPFDQNVWNDWFYIFYHSLANQCRSGVQIPKTLIEQIQLKLCEIQSILESWNIPILHCLEVIYHLFNHCWYCKKQTAVCSIFNIQSEIRIFRGADARSWTALKRSASCSDMRDLLVSCSWKSSSSCFREHRDTLVKSWSIWNVMSAEKHPSRHREELKHCCSRA